MILGLPSQGCQRFGHLQTLPSSGVVPQDDAASGGTPFVSGKNIVIIQRFKEHRAVSGCVAEDPKSAGRSVRQANRAWPDWLSNKSEDPRMMTASQRGRPPH